MSAATDPRRFSNEIVSSADRTAGAEKFLDSPSRTSTDITAAEQQSYSAYAPTDQLGSGEPHVFSDPARAAHWKNVYDNVQYEGRSRFDPAFTWTASAERRVKMKVIPVSFVLDGSHACV